MIRVHEMFRRFGHWLFLLSCLTFRSVLGPHDPRDERERAWWATWAWNTLGRKNHRGFRFVYTLADGSLLWGQRCDRVTRTVEATGDASFAGVIRFEGPDFRPSRPVVVTGYMIVAPDGVIMEET